jgi:hypothetical protein
LFVFINNACGEFGLVYVQRGHATIKGCKFHCISLSGFGCGRKKADVIAGNQPKTPGALALLLFALKDAFRGTGDDYGSR